MNTQSIKAIKDTIVQILRDSQINMISKYSMLHKATVTLCREIIDDDSIYTNNLQNLINIIYNNRFISKETSIALQCFRIDSQNIMNLISSPDTRLLELAAQIILDIDDKSIKHELIDEYTGLWRNKYILQKDKGKIKRIRCTFCRHDGEYIIAAPEEDPARQEIKVLPQKHDSDYTFHDTLSLLEKGMKLNLIDSFWDNDTLRTEIIVIEPDYLVDISTVADCVKDYGTHPANYYYRLLSGTEIKLPMILGNIVNMFLDEWIYSPIEPEYLNTMKKVFKKYSMELIACPEIDADEKSFFNMCHFHFENLRKTVNGIFKEKQYRLNANDAVLEPSYICEALGLQGRLDYMQRDLCSFIEMKSGKADEFSCRGRIEAQLSNKVQMMLYLATLQYNLDINHERINAYLLYTKYPLLYTSTPSWEMVRKAINTRNRIVACEYLLHKNNSPQFCDKILSEIKPSVINEYGICNKLWNDYIAPQIEDFNKSISGLDQMCREYYMALFTFISNELYLIKTGNGEPDRNTSTSIWDLTITEKIEKGIIIKDLKILENRITDIHSPFIIFSRNRENESQVLNFRNGDLIIIYECNHNYDNATNKMILKGNIEYITAESIKIRFRFPQRNPKVINDLSMYAMEPDYNDKPALSMFSSLNTLVKANRERIDLILGNREPEFDILLLEKANEENDDFSRIAAKSVAAKDMMLIIGPPGTGKTSWALRKMVEKHLENGNTNILLLSYTNRAVDEICKSISNIHPETDFIRLGNELSCDERYRSHLLENRLKECSRRSEARKIIESCNIFVSTVITLQSRHEIFKLKKFDCAIIDEATQILEPQILGILTTKAPDGDNAIKKFIMIGDNKQLPAITLQNGKDSEIKSEMLKLNGFVSFKESLFERLYRKYNNGNNECLDMLCRQGRMHNEIADFPNRYFYAGRLSAVGLKHQTEENEDIDITDRHDYSSIVRKRLFFIPSETDIRNYNYKINRDEAEISANLAYHIYLDNINNFDPDKTVGIITPYKNQIALIKQYLSEKGIEELNNITIDTVERYQGSERDYIIYSFCINKPYQIKMMANTIVENGHLIDRKLNVALTRARKHMFITGSEDILKEDNIYNSLINYMKKKKYYTKSG